MAFSLFIKNNQCFHLWTSKYMWKGSLRHTGPGESKGSKCHKNLSKFITLLPGRKGNKSVPRQMNTHFIFRYFSSQWAVITYSTIHSNVLLYFWANGSAALYAHLLWCPLSWSFWSPERLSESLTTELEGLWPKLGTL